MNREKVCGLWIYGSSLQKMKRGEIDG